MVDYVKRSFLPANISEGVSADITSFMNAHSPCSKQKITAADIHAETQPGSLFLLLSIKVRLRGIFPPYPAELRSG